MKGIIKMKKQMIDIIYEEIYQTHEYAEEQDKCKKDYNIARQRFVHTDEDETIFILSNCEQEKFGFIQGFKCAMQLMAECHK